MTHTYQIRAATPADVPLLLAVTGLTAESLADANSAEDFAAAQQANLLWVAVDEADSPIGFAMLAEIDQWLHLDELDVLPAYGRRGFQIVSHAEQTPGL